ncbi:MAG: CHAT domain-containing protein [Planctomycetota bacterium]
MRSFLTASIVCLCLWAVVANRSAQNSVAWGEVQAPGIVASHDSAFAFALDPADASSDEDATSAEHARLAALAALAAEQESFLTLLGGLRSIARDDEAETPEPQMLAALQQSARRLSESHGRKDALVVASFFSALPAEARALGIEKSWEYADIHGRAFELYWGESLSRAREFEERTIREELDGFISEARWLADVTPLAFGLSLRSRLRAADVSERVPESRIEKDRLRDAAEDARESITLFERAGLIKPSLDPRELLGDVECRLLHPAPSRKEFERCVRLAASIQNEEYRERSLFGLVQLGRDLGDVALIEHSLREVADFRDPDHCWPLAREYTTLLLHSDRPEGALRFLLRHAPAEEEFQAERHLLLAAVFLRCGDVASAQREIDQLDAPADDELLTLARARLGLAAGDTDELLERLELDAVWEDWSIEGQAQAYVAIGEAWLARGAPERALPWLQDALEVSSEWQAHQDEALASNANSGSITGEWIGMQAVVQLANAHAGVGQPLEAARVLEEHQARALRPSEYGLPSGVSMDELLSWAASYELGLISWGVGADDGLIAHVSPEGEAWTSRIPHGRRALESATRRIRESIQDGDQERSRELAIEIGAALFPAELRARLQGENTEQRVLLLLHGPLESLPVSMLELDGKPLDQSFVSVVLPGLPRFETTVLSADYGRQAARRWRLLGSPRDSTNGVLLPGADRELAALTGTYPNALVSSGEDFNRAALQDALQGEDPVHIATHMLEWRECASGRLAPVGLLMSHSDVLCADELLDWRPRLPLVALTACESAGGRFIDAEGLHGLSRAFLESGTRNLLVTLWPIEDRAAARFALLFHQNLLAGSRPSHAVRDARVTMATDGWPASAWAAFRFLGRD